MITKLIILYLLIMFFSFRIPSQKSKRGLKRKKLQERTPVVFHLHNLLDTVENFKKFILSLILRWFNSIKTDIYLFNLNILLILEDLINFALIT